MCIPVNRIYFLEIYLNIFSKDSQPQAIESAKIDGEVRYGKTLLSKKQIEQVWYS